MANLLRTVFVVQALICSKKASHLLNWQDVTTQCCSDAGVCWHISHTVLTLSGGEAKISESSYKRVFAYSPHCHPTLTALALPSLHVWVPCTLTGRVRSVFFTFTVIKACRKWWAKTRGNFNMSLNSTRARSEHSSPKKHEHDSHSRKTTLCNHLRK